MDSCSGCSLSLEVKFFDCFYEFDNICPTFSMIECLKLGDHEKISHTLRISVTKDGTDGADSLATMNSWIEKHAYLFQGKDESQNVSSRVIGVENLTSRTLELLGNFISVEDEIWAYYQWRLNDMSGENYSSASLWWQSRDGVFDQSSIPASRMDAKEQPQFSPLHAYSEALTIPLTLLVEDERLPPVSLKTSPCHFLRRRLEQTEPSLPYSFLASYSKLQSWVDVSEEMLITQLGSHHEAQVPTSTSHALLIFMLTMTVLILRGSPRIIPVERISSRSFQYVGRSSPWANALFNPHFHNDRFAFECEYRTGLDKVLDESTSAMNMKQLSGPDLRSFVVLRILGRVIPYLQALLSFEIFSLSAELDSMRRNDRSSHRLKDVHDALQRWEQKLYNLKACMTSADSQIEHILSRPTGTTATCDQLAMCDNLKRMISQFNMSHTKALDLVKMRKGNTFSDMQIELTNLQVQESRQAMEQADTVAKLTILAFVFIPISTVAGIFGMNVVEITGGTRIWVFGVTAGAVVAGTLLLAFSGTAWSWWRACFELFLLHPSYPGSLTRLSFFKRIHRSRGQLFQLRKFLIAWVFYLLQWLGRWKAQLIAWKKTGEKLRNRDRERRNRDPSGRQLDDV